MSAIADKKQNDKDKKRRVKARFTATADWHVANAELLKAAISAASNRGAALRFGFTRDGGAFCVGVYDNGESYNLYAGANDAAELDIMLRDIIEGFDGELPPAVT